MQPPSCLAVIPHKKTPYTTTLAVWKQLAHHTYVHAIAPQSNRAVPTVCAWLCTYIYVEHKKGNPQAFVPSIAQLVINALFLG